MTTNLKQANRLLLELSKKWSVISSINYDDSKLFIEYFKNSKYTYGNAWSYIIQGMYGIGKNGIGYKYYDKTILIPMCFYPKLENPDVLSFFMVRPMGDGAIDKVCEIAEYVHKKLKYPVYAKKIFENEFCELEKRGFKDAKQNPWHSTAHSEDDSFPERIIDVTSTLMYANSLGRTRQLNRSLRNYKNLIETSDKYIFRSIFDNIQDAKNLIKLFFSQRNYLISRPEDYHNIIEKRDPNVNYEESLIYYEGKPVGLYLCEIQNSEYASLYATITDRETNNYLTDLIMFHLMKNLQTKGIKYLNLGGSEFKSLDDFKLKFKPQISQQMYWATLF